jgi:hypothetical protein
MTHKRGGVKEKRRMTIGCNIYLWSIPEQNRLLTECIAPLVRDLLASGASDSFTCSRFDARGPHVMAIFGATTATQREVTSRVDSAIAAYLSRLDRVEVPSQAELEARHAACNGRTLCYIDSEPGLAEVRSFRIFELLDNERPLSKWKGMVGEDAISRLRTDLTLWAIAQLGATSTTMAAVRWVAALDRALSVVDMPRSALWGYLIDRRLRDRDFTKRVAAGQLTMNKGPLAISEANRATFARCWNNPAAIDGGCDLERLVTLVLADDSRPLLDRKELLRNIEYTTLWLLHITPEQVLPLFVFAWTLAVMAESSGVST